MKPYTLTVPGSAAKIDLVPVPAGAVTITSKDGKTTQVKIAPFYIAKTETPWEVFDAFTISGPPSIPYDQTPFAPDAIARPSKSYIPPDMGWGHHGYPVIHESFINATMFCRWLSSKTGKKYRLPTEAEWEYACRAGATGPWKMAPVEVSKIGWTAGNSDKQTHPVGKKPANAWGLYDMLGNAAEWATDLNGKPVVCGGAYSDKAADINPGLRSYQTPAWQETDPQLPKSRWWLSDAHFAGFRVICEP
jgi:formylglycine-generating enzyme required for sulfatase activity